MKQLQDLVRRLERRQELDQVAKPVAAAVRRVVAEPTVRNALSGVNLGHPLHPMLTDVPIGAWSMATLLDAVGGRATRPAADLLVATGLLAAVPTAATGLNDWSDTSGAESRVGLSAGDERESGLVDELQREIEHHVAEGVAGGPARPGDRGAVHAGADGAASGGATVPAGHQRAGDHVHRRRGDGAGDGRAGPLHRRAAGLGGAGQGRALHARRGADAVAGGAGHPLPPCPGLGVAWRDGDRTLLRSGDQMAALIAAATTSLPVDERRCVARPVLAATVRLAVSGGGSSVAVGVVESVKGIMWVRRRQPDEVVYGVALGHERFGPRELLDQAVTAEQAGFDLVCCSDHLAPWWDPGGGVPAHCGNAWV